MDSADLPLTAPELQSYFHRIEFIASSTDESGLEGLRQPEGAVPGAPLPTLANLSELISRHLQSIPFENLDLHLKRFDAHATWSEGPVKLLGRRGGWCFEHNGLLKRALLSMGFSVIDLGCRVCPPFEGPEHRPAPYGHRALLVEVPPMARLLGRQETHRTPRKVRLSGNVL